MSAIPPTSFPQQSPCPCTCPEIRKCYWCLKFSWPISAKRDRGCIFLQYVFPFNPHACKSRAHLIHAGKEKARGEGESSLICSFNCWTLRAQLLCPRQSGLFDDVLKCNQIKINARLVLKVWSKLSFCSVHLSNTPVLRWKGQIVPQQQFVLIKRQHYQ